MSNRYKVVGDRIVHGVKKGETLVADLLEHEEDLLVRGGHIEAVKKAPETAPAGGTVPSK